MCLGQSCGEGVCPVLRFERDAEPLARRQPAGGRSCLGGHRASSELGRVSLGSCLGAPSPGVPAPRDHTQAPEDEGRARWGWRPVGPGNEIMPDMAVHVTLSEASHCHRPLSSGHARVTSIRRDPLGRWSGAGQPGFQRAGRLPRGSNLPCGQVRMRGCPPAPRWPSSAASGRLKQQGRGKELVPQGSPELEQTSTAPPRTWPPEKPLLSRQYAQDPHVGPPCPAQAAAGHSGTVTTRHR